MAESTIQPAWVFLHEDGEGLNARVARCCVEALRAGPMGRYERADFYREFVSCGWEPPLERARTFKNLGQGIETLKTSCAVFARAVLNWSGRTTTRPGIMGQPVVDTYRGAGLRWGWLEGLTVGCPSWMTRKDGNPRPGDLFVREYSKHLSSKLIHVGFLVEHLGGDLWRTAEGGGGDGTRCRHETMDMGKPDSHGRVLVGWWRPERMEGFTETADTDPAPPPESQP